MTENILFTIIAIGVAGGIGWIITSIYALIRDSILTARWEREFAQEWANRRDWLDDIRF